MKMTEIVSGILQPLSISRMVFNREEAGETGVLKNVVNDVLNSERGNLNNINNIEKERMIERSKKTNFKITEIESEI